MRSVNNRLHVLVALATLALGACGGPPPPTMVELTMAASADANAIQSVPSPVVVRVYQLKSPAAFEEADYFQLDKSESDVLGDDLLGKDEYFISPGASQTVVSEVSPDTRYLGVVAAFYNIDASTWRGTVPVPANKTTAVTANIGPASVTVQ
jgi:type VI secretion system protein VasD